MIAVAGYSFSWILLTRYARALRDVGLSVGEPPARRGFPPSVFTALPQLFERAGNNHLGSITAFYSVLVEDEELADPIAEETRSLFDGHIVLSREIAARNQFPAIDVLASTSRVMATVAAPDQLAAAGTLRSCLAKYQEIELLLQIGEFEAGKDADADLAVGKIGDIRKFSLPTQRCDPSSRAFARSARRAVPMNGAGLRVLMRLGHSHLDRLQQVRTVMSR